MLQGRVEEILFISTIQQRAVTHKEDVNPFPSRPVTSIDIFIDLRLLALLTPRVETLK